MKKTSLLTRIGRELSIRPSYVAGKAIRHQSVARYGSFEEYRAMRLRREEAMASYQIWVDSGRPDLLLAAADSIGYRQWRLPKLRRYFLTALISVGNFQEAKEFAWNTLLMGAHNNWFLLRAIGDAYLLDDKDLVIACAEKFLAKKGSSATEGQRMFVLSAILRHFGEEGLRRIGASEIRGDSLDFCLHLSNLRFWRGDYLGQFREINRALDKLGMARFAPRNDQEPFTVANIAASQAEESITTGPLVTIMVSMYNSSRTILPVLESLSAQSYKDIEILVVDDCSRDASVEIARQYAHERDPRVRVIQMDKNGGTYRARNRGLIEARGEFFTCNDSDDWAHPSKIHSLVQPMLQDPMIVATRSKLLRVSSSMGIKPRPWGFMQDDQSSLCYRRREVVEQLGYYDTVKVGADSEFSERIVAGFGKASFRSINKPLLMADWSRASLTGEIGSGITDGGTVAPARLLYRSSFRERHKCGNLRVELHTG